MDDLIWLAGILGLAMLGFLLVRLLGDADDAGTFDEGGRGA